MKTGQGKTWSEDDARRKAVATAITALVANDRKLIDSITAERDSIRAERDEAVALLRVIAHRTREKR